MAQAVVSSYAASLPPTTPSKTPSLYAASLPPSPGKVMGIPLAKLRKARPAAAQQGYLGNLSQPQEAKLRALWAIAYKFVEVCEADASFQDAVTLEDKFVPPAMRSDGTAAARDKKSKKSKSKNKTSYTHERFPNLVGELLSLLPMDDRSPERLAREATEALDHWTPHMFRIVILHTVKQEHPDELVLRFLRRADWDIIRACKMMGRTVYWRTMEAAVDDDILRLGEGGAAEDEKNGQGSARAQGADFMRLLRSGKGFLHGNDRHGRPISYIRLRLHRPGENSPECMERYIIYLLEMARLSLRFPVETGTIFLDMTGFRMGNIDLAPLKFILKCAEQYYPESIGLIIIHKAPYGSKVLWRLIRHWVDSSISSKVKFTRSAKELAKHIDPSNMLRDHGGEDDWQYRYEEPMLDENFKMQNTITRNYLLLERQMLAEQFEATTREWVMGAQMTERAAEVAARRDRVCADLAANFWELDPYVRARSLYDRRGCLAATGNLQYHPPKSELRRHGSVATTTAAAASARRRTPSLSTASSSSASAATSSMAARSALGYTSSYSSAGGSAGARSSISGAGTASTGGTLVTCSLLGSPVKEDQYAEIENFSMADVATVGDESSYYSD